MPPSRGIVYPGLNFSAIKRPAWQGIRFGSKTLPRGPKSFSTIPRASKPLHTPLRCGKLLSQWPCISRPRPFLPSAFLGLRFNSSSPSQTPATTASSSSYPEPPVSFEQVNLDELADLSKDLSAVPEHIGYLRELGIEFNWGARATIEWTLEHIHVLAGTPWWLSIVLTVVFFRVLCLPLTMRMTDSAARLGAMGPALQPVREKIARARAAQDNNLTQEAFQDMAQVYKDAGSSPFKMIIPVLVPMWIGISSFTVLRAMTAIPVPGLLDGGFLWMQDLTKADPLSIIPIAASTVMYFALKAGGEAGIQSSSTFSPETMKRIQIGFPLVAFAITSFIPGAIQITVLTATVWGIGQAYTFRNPRARELLGLYPIIRHASSANARKQQPRVTITPTNPMKSYQAPQEQKQTMLQGAKKEAKGMFSEMKQSLWRNSGGAIGSDPTTEQRPKVGRRSSEFLKQAKKYERDYESWAGKRTKNTRK